MDNGNKIQDDLSTENSPYKKKKQNLTVKSNSIKEPILPEGPYKNPKKAEREIKSSPKVYSPNKSEYISKHENFMAPSSSKIRRGRIFSGEGKTEKDDIIEPIFNFKTTKKPAKPISIEKIQTNFANNLQETITAKEELKKETMFADRKIENKRVIGTPNKNIPSRDPLGPKPLRTFKSPKDDTPIMVNGRVLERENISPIKIYEESIMEKIINSSDEKIMATEPSKEIDLVKELREESKIFKESKRQDKILKTSSNSSSASVLSSASSISLKNSSGLAGSFGVASLKSSGVTPPQKVWKVSGTGKRLSSSNRLRHKDNFAFKTFDNIESFKRRESQVPLKTSYGIAQQLEEFHKAGKNNQIAKVIVDEEEIDELDNLSEEEIYKRRIFYRVKIGRIRQAFPQWNVPDYPEDLPIKTVRDTYEAYLDEIYISDSVDQYAYYLSFMWLAVEVVLCYFGYNIKGYTEAQNKNINKYRNILAELGEASVKGKGEKYSPEWRILIISLTQLAMIFAVNFFAKFVGKETAETLVNSVSNLVTGPPASEKILDENQEIPNTVNPSLGGGFTMNDIFKLVGNFIPGNQNNPPPEEKKAFRVFES